MGATAALAGASGYSGGELLRLLLAHPDLEIGPLAAGASAGRSVAELHPQLPQLAGRVFEPTEPRLLAGADVVFLALPHGQSAALVAQLPDSTRVVDLGADFRLESAVDWAGAYDTPHAGWWPYGLPELFRDDLSGATRIAGPGCNATAMTLALGPLLAAGLVEPLDLVTTTTSGTSGAGRAASAALLGSEVMGDLSAYKVASHRHTPEVRQSLRRLAGAEVTLTYTPALAPMPRGILATCTGRTSASAAELRDCLQQAYDAEPFVHVLPDGRWPRTGATAGSNACQLQVAVDADSGRAVIVSALDNLGKGAAGQALQCANIALGLDETAGLSASGGRTVSVTAPRGFRAAGVAAGLKTSGGPDVALVVNDGPSRAAACVFTSNRCKANPVLWSEQVVADGRVQAVVLNSGGANCYTGPEGFQTTHATAERAAARLGGGAGDVVVCSTGLIGPLFDRERVLAGVDAAHTALSVDGGGDAALAIMTTDTLAKQTVVAGPGFTVAGMAKGAGMLAPALATMLVVLTTDADVDAAACERALRAATRTTFDRLDSDGCQSTNDTVLLMASGASRTAPPAAEFDAAVRQACADLAGQLLRDAEGSAHDISIEVVGAASEDDAVEAGRAVARSNLFKCAVFGEDPNWGRVLAAVGTTSARFDPAALDVRFNGVQVCLGGVAADDPAAVRFDGRDVHVLLDLHAGKATATIVTNDLTTAYVHENSAYST